MSSYDARSYNAFTNEEAQIITPMMICQGFSPWKSRKKKIKKTEKPVFNRPRVEYFGQRKSRYLKNCSHSSFRIHNNNQYYKIQFLCVCLYLEAAVATVFEIATFSLVKVLHSRSIENSFFSFRKKKISNKKFFF